MSLRSIDVQLYLLNIWSYSSYIITRLGRYLSAYRRGNAAYMSVFRSTMKSTYLLIIYSILERYLPCFKFEWRISEKKPMFFWRTLSIRHSFIFYTVYPAVLRIRVFTIYPQSIARKRVFSVRTIYAVPAYANFAFVFLTSGVESFLTEIILRSS